MKSNAFFSLLVTFFYSSTAFAATDYNRQVERIGVQGSTAYFSVKEALSNNCKFDVVYVSLTNEFGKASFASLLAAQLPGKKISRLEYSQPSPGDTCTLTLLETTN